MKKTITILKQAVTFLLVFALLIIFSPLLFLFYLIFRKDKGFNHIIKTR